MSAAATITEASTPDTVLAPAGMPVRNGRLHLARIRHWLPLDGELVVVTGFATGCRGRHAHGGRLVVIGPHERR